MLALHCWQTNCILRLAARGATFFEIARQLERWKHEEFEEMHRRAEAPQAQGGDDQVVPPMPRHRRWLMMEEGFEWQCGEDELTPMYDTWS